MRPKQKPRARTTIFTNLCRIRTWVSCRTVELTPWVHRWKMIFSMYKLDKKPAKVFLPLKDSCQCHASIKKFVAWSSRKWVHIVLVYSHALHYPKLQVNKYNDLILRFQEDQDMTSRQLNLFRCNVCVIIFYRCKTWIILSQSQDISLENRLIWDNFRHATRSDE